MGCSGGQQEGGWAQLRHPYIVGPGNKIEPEGCRGIMLVIMEGGGQKGGLQKGRPVRSSLQGPVAGRRSLDRHDSVALICCLPLKILDVYELCPAHLSWTTSELSVGAAC